MILSLITNSDSNNLENLISALIGGLLVIIGQFLMELFKNRKEKRNRVIIISSKTREIEQLLKNDFRELAMFKTHVEYWWFCHNDNSIDDNYKKKYYEEHLRSQSESRITEKRIGSSIATYFGYVNEYLSINDSETVGIISELKKISNIEFKRANEYSISDDFDEIRNNQVIKDEKELREEYWVNLKPLKDINEIIYTKSKNYAQQWV